MARGGDGLKAEELKQGPHEDVRPGAEDVGPQKSVPLGAAGFRHVVKHAHRLLQQQLKRLGISAADGQHKSFTRAAEALGNNQPNITRCMNNLEQDLGCKLFVRTNHGVSLTPEGERLYSRAAIAFEQLQLGENEIRAD